MQSPSSECRQQEHLPAPVLKSVLAMLASEKVRISVLKALAVACMPVSLLLAQLFRLMEACSHMAKCWARAGRWGAGSVEWLHAKGGGGGPPQEPVGI